MSARRKLMSGKIRIVTDSASDITREELAKYDVTLVPMPLMIGEMLFFDDKTRPVASLWKDMQNGVEVKTSQPSPSSFLEVFRQVKADGDAVICILLAAALSGTCQSAIMAKEMAEYDEIYIVDSKRATCSQKLVAFEACRLRDETDMTAAQIAEHLEGFIDRIKLFACIDTLEYLVKGGRLSKVAGNIGFMLNIKPIIAFDDVGNIKVIKKVAGSKKAFSDLCGRIAETDIDTNYPVIPLFACSDANCRKMLGMLEETENFPSNLIPEEIGATIGPYIGLGGFGLTFVEKVKA